MLHLTTINEITYQLLQQIFTIDFIKEKFALAGGTALALQIGHRVSVDLDIFNPNSFDVKELEIILSSSTKFGFEYVGNNSRMLFALINNVKCDFVHEPATLLNPLEKIDGVNYFSVQDIAAMKLHTICGRGKRKDFFDVYALLQLYTWETLMEWFIKKYGETQVFMLQRSILYFEDAENDPQINGLQPFTNSWKEIKQFILNTCS